MRILLCVISLLYLCCSPALAQQKLPTTIFHKHIQTCHLIGTTEVEYVIKLYNDSTIEIEKFTSKYNDQYNSVLQVIFSGEYLQKGDSIYIKYSGRSRNIHYKNPPTIEIFKESPGQQIKYPPPVFILSENFILPVAGDFPILETSSLSKVSSIGVPLRQINLKKYTRKNNSANSKSPTQD